ncbi:methyltransferase domain-containing protein [candidate division KSB1 bacterium]|nr:methyltransferase domain-containing protein [candidate division KSB1 bacterium]
MNWQKKERLVEPYSKLAFIYDDVMSHVNYETWANYVSRIIEKWNPGARNLIDIACGTGSFLNQCRRYSYNLSGFDFSFDSIRMARKKGLELPFWVGDVRKFALKKTVDVIVCLYDSINYIMSLEQICEVFSSVYQALNSNGLFIFDICTERNSIKYFDNFFDENSGIGYNYTRHSSYDKTNKIHKNLFTINFHNSDEIYIEDHRQRIYYISELLDSIDKTEFEFISAFDDFSFSKASEKSIRVHFVLKKE